MYPALLGWKDERRPRCRVGALVAAALRLESPQIGEGKKEFALDGGAPRKKAGCLDAKDDNVLVVTRTAREVRHQPAMLGEDDESSRNKEQNSFETLTPVMV